MTASIVRGSKPVAVTHFIIQVLMDEYHQLQRGSRHVRYCGETPRCLHSFWKALKRKATDRMSVSQSRHQYASSLQTVRKRKLIEAVLRSHQYAPQLALSASERKHRQHLRPHALLTSVIIRSTRIYTIRVAACASVLVTVTAESSTAPRYN